MICPQGHASEATDYCDVCGEPMAAAAPAPAVPAADPAATQACPNCGTEAPAGALFCENCGYDFTTGTSPDPLEGPGSAPILTAVPTGISVPTPAPGSARAADPGEAGPAVTGVPAELGTPSAATPAPGALDEPWVAELWVDPQWYAEQAPEDPMPPVGSPRIVPLRVRSVLIGRPSRSRGIAPEVDCDQDGGVSRRHCQLTSDGTRWWVEDLQSANGTYVSAVGEPLPTKPLIPGDKHLLEDGERLYLGAWTRIVIRKALPGEA